MKITVREVGIVAVALTTSFNCRRKAWFRGNVLSAKLFRKASTLILEELHSPISLPPICPVLSHTQDEQYCRISAVNCSAAIVRLFASESRIILENRLARTAARAALTSRVES